jgi:hypothetical protein
VKLLLRRLGVGIVARFDVIVLRGQAEIIFRRSGRCSLLIARRDGRLDPVETGLKTHSKQLALNGPVSSRLRANYIAKLITSFRFILCHYFQTDYSYSSRDTSKSRGLREREREGEKADATEKREAKMSKAEIPSRSKMPWNLPAVIEYAISILGFYFQRYQID